VTSERTFRLYIDGEWVEPAAGHYAVINPATEDVVAEAPEASRQQVYDACRAAKAAFPAWSRTRPEERAEILHRVADVIGKHADDYAPLAQAETGATSATVKALQVNVAVQSDPDVQAFVERLEQAAGEESDEATGAIPSGETIARDLQRFLRQRGGETPP